MKKHICLIIVVMLSAQVFSQERFPSSEYLQMLENHPFGSISDKYTLILTGYFDDCGEFGGHKETIELIRIDRKLSAIITIYDKSCQETNYAKPKILKTNTFSIDENKVQYFQDYLSKLMVKSLELTYPYHAGRNYSAVLEFKKTNDEDDGYKNRRLKLEFHDVASSWTEFQKLKSIVKK